MELDLWEYLKTAEKPIVLYGMGNGADKIITQLEERGIPFRGVFASDGFVRNKTFHGFKIESYRTLKEKFGDMIVLLCFGTHLKDVMENIKKIASECELYAPEVPVIGSGLFNLEFFNKNKVGYEKIYSILGDELSKKTLQNTVKYKISGKIEYLFDCETDETEPYHAFLRPEGGEIILDLGAYNGDTALELSHIYYDYKKIIAVEPDRKSYKKLLSNTENLRSIETHNLCISDFTGKGEFAMNGGRNSVVGEGSETDFSTVDDLLKGEKVTLIKMDVEGEELKSINGAERTIATHKPKMIISCYHRTEDFFTLPQRILQINPEYKVYMRHFPSLPAWDTVYYFI